MGKKMRGGVWQYDIIGIALIGKQVINFGLQFFE